VARRTRVIVKVEGARRLRATLKQAGDDLEDLKAAHARAAAIVVARGRPGAPVGETGRLAASVRGSGTKAGAIVRAGSAALPYAGVQEWGWPARHIAAQPFLVPAALETEPTWYPAYQAEVQAILDRVKGT
jgi:phage gpG-like protein